MTKGKHIFVRRPNGWMTRGMLHHGIDLGDSTVIHFTGLTKADARIFRTNIKRFENYGKVEVFPYDRICQFAAYEFGDDVSQAIVRDYYKLGEQVPPPNVKPRLSNDVVNEAFKWLGTTFLGNQYNPANNNCEHFASGCATGYAFSLQVQYEKEFLHRRGSLGGLLSVLFTEWTRFDRNPYAEPKDGWYYVGTTYRDSKTGNFYRECYSKPGEIPPKWYMSRKFQEQGKEVEQKIIPYPLSQLVHHYVNKHNQTHEEKAE